MEIIRAKTAGFCFGVDRAVKLTYDLLAQGRKVATLGPLIHNAQVVADLEAKGAVTCPDIDAVPDGYEVIIRSHGVPRSVYDKISTRSLAYHDATCPFVAKIHKIAMEADKKRCAFACCRRRRPPRSTGNCRPYKRPCAGFCQSGGAAKIAPHAFATRIHLRRRTNDISRGKLGKLQSFFKKKSVQKPEFLIQYVMQRGRGNRKRKTSAKNAITWSSLVVIILPIPKSCYRSPRGIPRPSTSRLLMNSTLHGLLVRRVWA